MGYLLVSPLRNWISEKPEKLLTPYLREGLTVVEPGPGMGFFTIPMAHKVGKTGRVIAIDIQPKMLESLRRRANEAGVEKRIETRLVQAESLELGDLIAAVDFVLAFAVVHEMLSVDLFFRQVSTALKTGGLLLLAEPQGHVDASEWKRELESANAAGLDTQCHPRVRRSRAALFRKT
jgi:ubiquinone/menaquinone biosynthesis C-methylase UbiE